MANIVGSREIRPVKLNKDVLDFLLGLLIHILLVVGHQGLGERLSDGIHLQKAHDTLSLDPVWAWIGTHIKYLELTHFKNIVKPG